jgi:hypothetical protein
MERDEEKGERVESVRGECDVVKLYSRQEAPKKRRKN